MPPQSDRTAGYVIEHRNGTKRTIITASVVPLAPIAANLVAHGEEGELVVVRRDTGELMIRWPLGSGADCPDNPQV